MNNLIINAIKTSTALIIGTYSMQYTLNYIKCDCEKQKEKREHLQNKFIHQLQ